MEPLFQRAWNHQANDWNHCSKGHGTIRLMIGTTVYQRA
jgi:hypothetical protein